MRRRRFKLLPSPPPAPLPPNHPHFQVCLHSPLLNIKTPRPSSSFCTNTATRSSSGISQCTHRKFSFPSNNYTGASSSSVALKELRLKLSPISPEAIRPFWRVSTLKPEHVLSILQAFQFECGKEATKGVVGLLWELFNLPFNNKGKDFEENHLPRSYQIMFSMLIQVGLLPQATSLVQRGGGGGEGGASLLSDASKIVESYAVAGDLENSISMYNWMRTRGIIPSRPCFHLFLNHLIQMRKSDMALRVYRDMVEVGFGLNNEDMTTFEFVTKLLCKQGKVHEAKKLVNQLENSPSPAVLDTIADGFVEKGDFDDLLIFLNERGHAPGACICNKILFYQCRKFGTDKAYLFMKDLEQLGFIPNEITFSILISWSCRDGKLKDAFIYLSKLLSRSVKPDVHTYNALISGVFKGGMYKHASDIFHEMLEREIMPDLSTFKVLLAGYCKFRHFDEAKAIIKEMVKRDLVQLSSLEDPLSKAFVILGFKPSAVKVKRDNDAGLWKAEFFDTLGNGFYLETNLNEYEKMVTRVLEDALVFYSNSLILAECGHGNVKAALTVKENMICRGEKLSLSAYSALVQGLCVSGSHVTKAVDLLEEMPQLAYQLDQETLNLLIRVASKKRIPRRGWIMLEWMVHRDFPIESETYTAVIMGLCKKGTPKELKNCWVIARKNKWLPSLKDCKALVECFCKQKMLEELLELLENMLGTSVHLIAEISNIFLEVLCSTGHTSIAISIVEEVLGQKLVLNYTAYSHLIRGFCEEKKYQEAIGVLDTMLRKNITPYVDVYSQLIHQLCKSCGLEKCMILKEIVLRNEPEASHSVYSLLVNGLCKVGKMGQASLQFQEMMARGISPDTDTYNIMIQGYCHDDNSRKVGQLLGVMVRKNTRISLLSFRNLVSLMCKHNRLFHVLNLKEFMLRETKSPLVIYNILIFRLFRTGNDSLIKVILQEMYLKGMVLDEVTYNFLVFGYYVCKDVSKALEAMETMIDKDLQPSYRSLTMIIKHLCSHRSLDKALELSGLMELRSWVHGSIVQHSIVEGLICHGRLLEAEHFLNRIKERSLIPNNVVYDILIKRFCWYGKLNVAVGLLNIVLKKGGLPDPTSYDSVVQGFCNCNAVDEALNLHAEMLARSFKPSMRSWDMLINRLCRNGRIAESERLFDSMLQLGQTPTRNMYQFVIDGYCLENNLNKASEFLHKMQQNGYVPDFNTHWSLISNLSNSKNKNDTESGGFLSKLLSFSGFTHKKDTKIKVG